MTDEPRQHRLYMILLAVVSFGTVPFLFVGRETRFLLGIPVWLWWSIVFTVALSAVTAWGLLRLWKDDEHD